jgi:hypothetical protein
MVLTLETNNHVKRATARRHPALPLLQHADAARPSLCAAVTMRARCDAQCRGDWPRSGRGNRSRVLLAAPLLMLLLRVATAIYVDEHHYFNSSWQEHYAFWRNPEKLSVSEWRSRTPLPGARINDTTPHRVSCREGRLRSLITVAVMFQSA